MDSAETNFTLSAAARDWFLFLRSQQPTSPLSSDQYKISVLVKPVPICIYKQFGSLQINMEFIMPTFHQRDGFIHNFSK